MSKPLALIIEDDPQLSTIFSISLQNEFETRIALDGDSALEQLAHLEPSVIILDLNLPGVPGKTILHHIRANARLAHCRGILATADAAQAEILQDEADIVLLKPISPIQLRSLAARLHPTS